MATDVWCFAFRFVKEKTTVINIKADTLDAVFKKALNILKDFIKLKKDIMDKSFSAVLMLDRAHFYSLKKDFSDPEKILKLKPEQAKKIFFKIEYNK